MSEPIDGLLLVDKPAGWTSFDVVAKVRGELKHSGIAKPKVGHTGTLDPLATGLLVLVLGNYCKRAQEFSKMDKTYVVTMKLGWTSTTGDEEGELREAGLRMPEIGEIKAALQEFTGEIEQVPPAYSAIKVGGQRAYKLARAGTEVKLEPRKVTVYSLQVIGYDYPEVKFKAQVSSGTYIRSLAQDIGQKLGTDAYLTALQRTQVGNFQIESSLSITKLNVASIYQNKQLT